MGFVPSHFLLMNNALAARRLLEVAILAKLVGYYLFDHKLL
ncbi:hypothetical protein AXFE_16200 [Acidithrix ferrooxidans]|uniref:Uncharacterized protein n=1 Tax=Acidithrix ferrooxidans TaxID=1280514 RepID=A0A0D8HHV5_9ACTN|nr:hypothetical protein AXFE_16200 [Acidithrix ferrooxidans]